MFNRWIIRGLAAYGLVLLSVPVPFLAQAQEAALCAEVKIEILQELSFERQGFEATMRITNSLDTFDLENINIAVYFTDVDGNPVTGTSDSTASDAEFFIRIDNSRNLDQMQEGADGQITNGVVTPGAAGEIRWLIIPTATAAGQSPNGQLFFVGATLSYAYGGKEETVEVAPDSIVVKPQPALTLDYFLTQEIVGDDAFTPVIEAPEPYTLGVRINNNGYGSTSALKIESAQPTIVANEQGLAADFKILGSFLEDKPSAPSLLIDFGEIEPQGVSVGRWIMETNLAGKFIDFEATYTHADELGGELTSLLQATNDFFLVKDVRVDVNGRDNVKDFLAYKNAGELLVFESERTGLNEPLCTDCAAVASQSGSLGADAGGYRTLTANTEPGFTYIKVADPYKGTKVIGSAVRSDGKVLDANNAWVSKERAADNINFDYFINLFDSNSSGNYTLYFSDPADTPQPPVMRVITPRTTYEGGQVGFLVQASDPNGTVPVLTHKPLPVGAEFSDQGNGEGVFKWYPQTGQAGEYKVTFIAGDGALESKLDVMIRVNPANDKDGDGMADSWELEHFGNLDRDGSGDWDNDGRSDLEEHENQTDPTVPESAPGVPQIAMPIFDGEVLDGSAEPLLPPLSIHNGAHNAETTVQYRFEVYAEEGLTTLVASALVAEGAATTAWPITQGDLVDGQSFADNHLYFWRVRTETVEAEPVFSEWANSRFFINTANDAPSQPQISQPAQDSIVAALQPVLAVNNATDIDRDALTYGFKLFHESDLAVPLYQTEGLAQGESGETQWQVPAPLLEDNAYVWQASVKDEHGVVVESGQGAFLVSTINHAPVAPAIKLPVNASEVTALGANGSVALTAFNSEDPEQQPLHYLFEIDVVNTFDSAALLQSDPIAQGSGTTDADSTAWTVENLQENTRYHWRVKAGDGVVQSAWAVGEFFVNTANEAPSAPTLNNPGAGAVVESLRPVLQANPAIDPDEDPLQYRFEIYRDAGATDRVAERLLASSQWSLDFDLEDNSHFYWRARAEDDAGAVSDWSALSHFMVNENGVNDPPQMAFVLPDADVVVSAPMLTLQWTDSDPDSNASISLYYRYGGGALVPVASGLSEDSDAEADSYAWDVSALAPGTYTIHAEITDGDNTVSVDGCCTITVPQQEKTITVNPLTPLETEESGISLVRLQISLNEALAAGTSLTLNVSVSDVSEGAILGNAYVNFNSANWDQPQTVQVKGIDDCDIDGAQNFSVLFQPAVSDDPAYNGFTPDSVTLGNADNESAGQTLFICDYDLVSQTEVEGSGELDFVYRARLQNTGATLEGASAQLTLLASPEPGYAVSLVSGGNITFGHLISGTTVAGNETFTLRYNPAQALDRAKLRWAITPGAAADVVEGSDSDNNLSGTAAADVIDGKAGNDTLYGGDGDDTLIGGAGNDSLYGENGDDTFVVAGTEPYVDLFSGGAGFDRIRGGNGDDHIRMATFSGENTVEEIDALAGANAIYGTVADNVLDFTHTRLVNIAFIDGLAGKDTIYGSADADTIVGGSGNDQLFGNAGDDVFIKTGTDTGSDQISGGEGHDTVLGGDGDDRIGFSIFSGDYVVEVIDGGAGINLIEGTSAADMLDFRHTTLTRIARIEAGEGNDTVYGSLADDVIVGGNGNDVLFGEEGDDLFFLSNGDTGFNVYNGGSGHDVIKGTALDDIVGIASFSAEDGIEVIDGDGGHNVILGSPAGNLLDFQATVLIGIAQIQGGDGNDTIYGNDDANVIVGGRGADRLYGMGGDDVFVFTEGDTGANRFFGGDGVDLLLGTTGDDIIYIDKFDERIDATVEVIDGNGGYDIISGRSSADILDFSNTQLIGIAEIDGGESNDWISGNDDANMLVGGMGRDLVYGNGGDDIFPITSGDTDYDRYYGGDGADRISGTPADDIIRLRDYIPEVGSSVEIIDGNGGQDVIRGSDANNILDFGNTQLIDIVEIDGGDGNDYIVGNDDDNVIIGGLGSDRIYGNGGDDVFPITSGDAGYDRYYGGDGADRILGASADDIIRLLDYSTANGSTVEIIDGNGGRDVIRGNDANNVLDFSNTQLIGIVEIHGRDGNDYIAGNDDDNVITGGNGVDRLLGNGGSDVYRFAPGDGADTIMDNGATTDTDVLSFDSGIGKADIWLVHAGDSLVIYLLNSSDTVTIPDWFSDVSRIIERITTDTGGVLPYTRVSDLADVMTAIGTPVEGVINPTAEQQQQVDDARAAAWQ